MSNVLVIIIIPDRDSELDIRNKQKLTDELYKKGGEF